MKHNPVRESISFENLRPMTVLKRNTFGQYIIIFFDNKRNELKNRALLCVRNLTNCFYSAGEKRKERIEKVCKVNFIHSWYAL